MLAGLLAAPPVGAAAAALAGQRHPIAAARLRARRHGEAARRHGLDFGATLSPEREATTRAARYTYLDHRSPPVVRAPGCWSTAGAFSLRPTPWRSAPGGERAPAQRERKGSERRKVFAKQNPEGGQAKPVRAFGASLARTTAGATLLALARFLRCLSQGREEILRSAASGSLPPFPRLAANRRWTRGSGRTGDAAASCAPPRRTSLEVSENVSIRIARSVGIRVHEPLSYLEGSPS